MSKPEIPDELYTRIVSEALDTARSSYLAVSRVGFNVAILNAYRNGWTAGYEVLRGLALKVIPIIEGVRHNAESMHDDPDSPAYMDSGMYEVMRTCDELLLKFKALDTVVMTDEANS